MLSENQSNLLKSLHSRRLDLNELLINYQKGIENYRDELKLVESAIINLEAELEIE